MPAKKYFDPIEKFKRERFWAHKGVAKQRGIPFLFTFEDWYDVWEKSGHWHERGNKPGLYCMSRYGDQGAYEVGNVFIQLWTKNTSDAHKNKPKKESTKVKLREARKNQVMAKGPTSKQSITMKNKRLCCLGCKKEIAFGTFGIYHKKQCFS